MTKEIKKAFDHVKIWYPNLSMVVFDKTGSWRYMDENFNPLVFDKTIDVGLLEDACDSVPTLPYIYQP